MMDTIKLEAVGERVRVTCRREVGDIAKVRWLSGHEAVALGLLLASKTTAHYAINLDINAEVSVQIINAPYDEIWLTIRDLRGTRSLVVGIEGKTIREIGRRLLRLGNATLDSVAHRRFKPWVRPVWHSYFEEAE